MFRDGAAAMNIIRRRPWDLPERLATPEQVYLDRRSVLAGLGGFAAIAASPFSVAEAAEDPLARYFPAPRNEAYKLDRSLTPEEINGKYNNFYEFGTSKQISAAAQKLKTQPWRVTIDGLVAKPIEMDVAELVAKMPLEERLYRHRCVEAWSMTIPFTGFSLAELVKLAEPKSDAKYLRMETFFDPSVAVGQKQPMWPWPYVEGLTIPEAMNELSFLVVGTYGKVMAKQHGAPLRLATPWKYGFKSIKSIVKFSFVSQRPESFWQGLQGGEYGFWANVNPAVDHPRWSQARERVLHSGETVPTLIYNGYGDQVGHLYKDMKGENLFI